MKARELMQKRAECISATTPITSIAKKMQEDDIGAIAITENGQLVGMVTDRDVACRAIASGKDLSKVTARDVMTEGIVCCPDTEEADEAGRLMESKHIHRLAVLDENKKMVGMLRLEDVAVAAKGNGAFLMPIGFNTLPGMKHQDFRSISGPNGGLHESMVALNTEWIRLMNQRLTEDFAMPQQLAKCKTLQDAWSVYGAFCQKAAAQYLEAFQRLAKVGQDIVAANRRA